MTAADSQHVRSNTNLVLDAQDVVFHNGVRHHIPGRYDEGMANKLREVRIKYGLTQAALAELASTSQAQIERLETGLRTLTPTWAKRLAKALGCHPLEIILAVELSPEEAALVTLFSRLTPAQQQALSSFAATLADQPTAIETFTRQLPGVDLIATKDDGSFVAIQAKLLSPEAAGAPGPARPIPRDIEGHLEQMIRYLWLGNESYPVAAAISKLITGKIEAAAESSARRSRS